MAGWRGFLRDGPRKVFHAPPQSKVSHTKVGNNLACPMGGQLLQNGPEEGLFKNLAGNFLLLLLSNHTAITFLA